MTPLRDLVRDRLRGLGLKQQDLAIRLGIDPANLSKILGGTAPVPIDRGGDWISALRLSGVASEQLLDALHLAAASGRVRDLVDRLEQAAARGDRLDALFRDRVGVLRFVLDHLAAAPGQQPDVIPPVTLDARQMLKLIEDLARAARHAENGAAHVGDDLRVAEPVKPYEPPAPGRGADDPIRRGGRGTWCAAITCRKLAGLIWVITNPRSASVIARVFDIRERHSSRT